MKKIKLLLKILFYTLICCGFLVLAAEFSLRYLLPLPKVKTKIAAEISSVLGADLHVGDISAGLFYIELENVIIDTSKVNLVVCKNIKMNLNVFKLLFGHLSIKNIVVNQAHVQIIKNKDGVFNFEELSSDSKEQTKAAEENSSSGVPPIDLRIQAFHINNSRFIYMDLKEDMTIDLKNINIALHNFKLDDTFDLTLALNSDFKQKDLEINNVKLAFSSKANLGLLDEQDSFFSLNNLLIAYQNTLLKTKANIKNFENPIITFNSKLTDLSQDTLLPFTQTAAFNIPLIEVKGKIEYKDPNLNIDTLNLKIEDTTLDLHGKLILEQTLKAEGKINLTAILESWESLIPTLKEYKPSGQIGADFDFAWPLKLKGDFTLQDIGFYLKNAGNFEKFNTQAEIKSIDEINIPSLTGIINKNPFSLQAKYLKKKDSADISLNFKADKLYIFSNNSKEENINQEIIPQDEQLSDIPVQPQEVQKESQTTKKEQESFVPININAQIDINKMDIPYFKGNKVLFTAKAKNLTSQMDKTHGTFNLTVGEGQIKDIYVLSNANAITKVMFMSLSIVSKVINTLNVLDLLSGMGKLLTRSKADGDDEEIIKHQKIKGKMDFESFQTIVDFDDGLATMKKCSFISNLFSFRVNGKINFNDRNIKLNVDSAPGKHTEEGIMPLNIDIRGTIEEPKGSLSVISSVSTLVSNTITKNPVSNILKSTWGKLFSPKDKNAEQENFEVFEQEQTQEEISAQETK